MNVIDGLQVSSQAKLQLLICASKWYIFKKPQGKNQGKKPEIQAEKSQRQNTNKQKLLSTSNQQLCSSLIRQLITECGQEQERSQQDVEKETSGARDSIENSKNNTKSPVSQVVHALTGAWQQIRKVQRSTPNRTRIPYRCPFTSSTKASSVSSTRINTVSINEVHIFCFYISVTGSKCPWRIIGNKGPYYNSSYILNRPMVTLL